MLRALQPGRRSAGLLYQLPWLAEFVVILTDVTGWG
jgi:hypothetical protein